MAGAPAHASARIKYDELTFKRDEDGDRVVRLRRAGRTRARARA